MQMEGESAQRFAARLLERVQAEAPALDVALRWVEAEGAFRAETASAGMGLIRFADGKCDVRPEAEAWTRISILHVLREGGGAQDNAALALDRALAGLICGAPGREVDRLLCRAREAPTCCARERFGGVLCEAAVVSVGGQARLVVFSCEKSGCPGKRG